MMRRRAVIALAAVAVASVGSVSRSSATEIQSNERRSGYTFMAPDTQAIQDDDTTNPGMLSVLDGEKLWSTKAGTANQACADCHHDARASMKGVAARYPAFDASQNRPVTLEQRINLCRTQHQNASPLPYESRDLLALTAFVARQARGLPIAPSNDPRLEPYLKAGHDIFMGREGQLNLACTNCHDDNWDKHLAGSAVTQAHPTGYPQYRLEWQTMGSLERRLRSCMAGVRAQPFDFGSLEMVELELFLMSRAKGMTIETPAVRP